MLEAFNPLWAVRFFVHNGLLGFLVLGAVVLAVTGAEALYADMGHFGRQPIRIAATVQPRDDSAFATASTSPGSV